MKELNVKPPYALFVAFLEKHGVKEDFYQNVAHQHKISETTQAVIILIFDKNPRNIISGIIAWDHCRYPVDLSTNLLIDFWESVHNDWGEIVDKWEAFLNSKAKKADSSKSLLEAMRQYGDVQMSSNYTIHTGALGAKLLESTSGWLTGSDSISGTTTASDSQPRPTPTQRYIDYLHEREQQKKVPATQKYKEHLKEVEAEKMKEMTLELQRRQKNKF